MIITPSYWGSQWLHQNWPPGSEMARGLRSTAGAGVLALPINMSATLTFAQTHHCDIKETILCWWEVRIQTRPRGKIRPRWHVKDTLNTVIYLHGETISPDHHEGSKSATPYDQYAKRANNINFIFRRDQHSPPPQNNMLVGEITSTLSSWGIKISHPLWTIRWLRDINSGQTSRLQRTCSKMLKVLGGWWFTSFMDSWSEKHQVCQ